MVCLSPVENTWKQGIIIRSVVGVPDSFIIEINGQQYKRNKCDITLSPLRGNDGAVGGATGNQHAKEQVVRGNDGAVGGATGNQHAKEQVVVVPWHVDYQ